jgi:hypothetical protein
MNECTYAAIVGLETIVAYFDFSCCAYQSITANRGSIRVHFPPFPNYELLNILLVEAKCVWDGTSSFALSLILFIFLQGLCGYFALTQLVIRPENANEPEVV